MASSEPQRHGERRERVQRCVRPRWKYLRRRATPSRQALHEKGEREMAIKSFESYLRELPNAADAAQVEKLIGRLR